MTAESFKREDGETVTRVWRSQVSVIVPCYAHSQYLCDCLSSLQAQTIQNWEAVVVDDSSPDGHVVEQVISRMGDRRIRLIRHQTNRGLSAARNTGVRAATSDLVICVDADDKLVPRCLERLLQPLMDSDAIDCVVPDYCLFGTAVGIRETHVPLRREILRVQPLGGAGGMLMRRSLWESLGGYDEAGVLRAGREDWEFFIRMFTTVCRAVRVPESLYLYRISSDSMDIRCRATEHLVRQYIYRKHRALFDQGGEGRVFVVAGFSKAAVAALEAGNRAKAALFLLRALCILPSWTRLRELLRVILPGWIIREWQRWRNGRIHGSACR